MKRVALCTDQEEARVRRVVFCVAAAALMLVLALILLSGSVDPLVALATGEVLRADPLRPEALRNRAKELQPDIEAVLGQPLDAGRLRWITTTVERMAAGDVAPELRDTTHPDWGPTGHSVALAMALRARSGRLGEYVPSHDEVLLYRDGFDLGARILHAEPRALLDEILVHELVHAWQHQHLKGLDWEFEAGSLQQMFRRALMEGHAEAVTAEVLRRRGDATRDVSGEMLGESDGLAMWPYTAGKSFVEHVAPDLGAASWLQAAWDRADACPWHVDHPDRWVEPGQRDEALGAIRAWWSRASRSRPPLVAEDDGWTVLVGARRTEPWAAEACASIAAPLAASGGSIEIHVWSSSERLADAWDRWTEHDVREFVARRSGVAVSEAVAVESVGAGHVRRWTLYVLREPEPDVGAPEDPLLAALEAIWTGADAGTPRLHVAMARRGDHAVVIVVPWDGLLPSVERLLASDPAALEEIPTPGELPLSDNESLLLRLRGSTEGRQTIPLAPIEQALLHEAPVVRRAALEIVAAHAERLPPASLAIVPVIHEATHARDDAERLLALHALAALDPRRALVRAAEDPHRVAQDLAMKLRAHLHVEDTPREVRSQPLLANLLMAMSGSTRVRDASQERFVSLLEASAQPGAARDELVEALSTCAPAQAWVIAGQAGATWQRVSLREARSLARWVGPGPPGRAAAAALRTIDVTDAVRRLLCAELLVEPRSRAAGLRLLLAAGAAPPRPLAKMLSRWREADDPEVACLAALAHGALHEGGSGEMGAVDVIRARWDDLSSDTLADVVSILPCDRGAPWLELRALALDSPVARIRRAAFKQAGGLLGTDVAPPALVEACLDRVGATSPAHAADLLVGLLLAASETSAEESRLAEERLAARLEAWLATGQLPTLAGLDMDLLCYAPSCSTSALVTMCERVLASSGPLELRALCGWLRCRADREAWPLDAASVAALGEVLRRADTAAVETGLPWFLQLVEAVQARSILDKETWLRVLEPHLATLAAYNADWLARQTCQDEAFDAACRELLVRHLDGSDAAMFRQGLALVAELGKHDSEVIEQLEAKLPQLLPAYRERVAEVLTSLRNE